MTTVFEVTEKILHMADKTSVHLKQAHAIEQVRYILGSRDRDATIVVHRRDVHREELELVDED